MTVLTSNWFTEIDPRHGSAFSLEGDKLHEEQTPYQHIAIYQTRTYGRLMVIDGCVMLTDRDNFLYHEMMSHPALFSHPDPKRVVIIGGGDCGTLREVLRHRGVESAVQVELDERVTRLAEQYFPELCSANADPRAQLVFDDGIKWMKSARGDSLDVVIVDSTDPVGPALGLFNEDFYRSTWAALGENGLLVQQSESPLYHLESVLVPMHQAMRKAGFSDVQTLHFPQPVYPSGWWSATLAVKSGKIGLKRIEAMRDLGTRYYSLEMHEAAFALPPFVKEALLAAR